MSMARRVHLVPTVRVKQGHDIIVIGGSAGSVQALQQIVAAFPPNLPAAVFVVVHTAAGFDSALAAILSSRGPLKASLGLHGEPIESGRIYVAPPDNHLVLRPGYIAVQRGPKENGHRPAVDPLFRSASVAYGPRVVAVVLSGYLDCGTAGLVSVKARGGIAIVQRPDDAEVPEMPRNAMKHVAVDHALPLAEIGPALVQLTRVEARIPGAPPRALREVEGEEPGLPSDVVCPICQGTLTEAQMGGLTNFRCHVGHAFSPAALLAEQAESLERALWAAARALEESARIAKRMATADAGLGLRFEEKARTQMQQADLIRRMLLGAGTVTTSDAEDLSGNGNGRVARLK